MNRYLIYFDELNIMSEAIGKLAYRGINIIDTYSPFPVSTEKFKIQHSERIISNYALLFGIIGLISALLLQYYTDGVDYRLNLGDKPYFSFITSVPIIFVITILFSATSIFIYIIFKFKSLSKQFETINKQQLNDNKFACLIESELQQVLLEKELVALGIYEYCRFESL